MLACKSEEIAKYVSTQFGKLVFDACFARHFDNSTCDVVFVVVITGDMYEIPSSEINVKGALTLTSDWDKYKVSL